MRSADALGEGARSRKSTASRTQRRRPARGRLGAVVECLEDRLLLSITDPVPIAIAQSKVDGTTLSIPVPVDVAAQSTVIVALALDPSSTTVTASDTAGNTYTADLDVTNGSGTSGVRTLIFSAPVMNPLLGQQSGSVAITIDFGAAVTAKAVSAFSVPGLLTTSTAADQSATATGTNQTISIGPTPATSQPEELLVAAAGVEDAGVSLTPGGGFTSLNAADTTGGTSGSNIGVAPAYRIVGPAQAYSFNGTLASSASWAAGLVTYRAAPDTTPPTITTSSSPLSYQEGAPATPIDGSLSLQDPDNGLLNSAQVAITSGFVQGEDVLGFNDQNGISGTRNAAGDVLTLTGVATIAQYQAAHAVGDVPQLEPRAQHFAANDRVHRDRLRRDRTPATRSINVNAVNTPPTLTLPGTQSVSVNQTLTINGISVSDVDAGPADIQVTLSVSGGTLDVTPGVSGGLTSGQISGRGTGTVTLTGPLAAIDATLSGGVTYRNGVGLRNGGNDPLTVTANDLGNTGSGGPQTTSAMVPITVLSQVDLATAMTLGGQPYVGQDLTYIVTLTNRGVSDATAARVTDTLPTGVTVKSFTTSQGTATLDVSGQILFDAGTVVAGTGTATLTIVVTPTLAASNQTITNTATASSGSQSDADPTNDTSSLSQFIGEAADLGVTIDASPTTILVGQEVTYTVGVTNFGPNQSTGATLTVDLTPGVLFNAGSSSPGFVYDSANNRVTLALPDIVAGTSRTFSVVVQATPASGSSLSATATVAQGNEKDLITGNNTATTSSSTTPSIDLGVTIADDPDPVFVGQDLTYTVVVRNTGQSDALGVVLTDTLPANVSFQSVTVPQTATVTTANNSQVVVSLGSLASGGSATITIVVRPTTAQPGGSIFTNTAVVAHDPSQTDPQPANDQATQQTTVNPLVHITISTQALDPNTLAPVSTVLVRGQLLYQVTVHNAGPSPATGVVVTSLLPAGVSVVSTSTTPTGLPTVVNQSSVVMNVGTLGVNQSATLQYVVVVNPTAQTSGRFLNSTASVSSTETDESLQNTQTATPLSIRALDVGAFRIEFPSYAVDELVNTGKLDVIIQRVGGTEGPQLDPSDPNRLQTQGTVSVHVATADGTALAGLNYKAISTDLTFAVGQSQATVTIPIFDDLIIRRDALGNLINRLFTLTLSNPTDGSALLENVSPTSDVTINEGDSLVVRQAGDGTRLKDQTDPTSTPLPAPGTLRYAITVANNTPNLAGVLDTIGFNVTGSTLVTITPGSALPILTEAVQIDGNQQPGFAGTPVVNLSGGGKLTDGLVIDAAAGGSIVQGLAITGFNSAGLRVLGAGNVIRGNFFGLDPLGIPAGNGVGVLIVGGTGNTIGGVMTGDRNVISANLGDGLRLESASNNAIRGNFLGTDRFGTIAATLPSAFGNGGAGVQIVGASDNNVIGAALGPVGDPSTTTAAGNVIANNGGAGVGYRPDPLNSTLFGVGNAVRLNSIDLNAGDGIGFDTADGQSVPAVPTLTGASSASGKTSVQGRLVGRPGVIYRIDIYASPDADPTGSQTGEGRLYVGTFVVTTLADGTTTFSGSFNATVTAGWIATATATAEDVPTTSPFSLIQSITAGLVVTNTQDTGAGSLHDVLQLANQTKGVALVTFAIPTEDPFYDPTRHVFIIHVVTPLPHLTNTFGIIVDATTQATFLLPAERNPDGPEVVVDGSQAGAPDGFVLDANGNTIKDLTIQHFSGAGVRVAGTSSGNLLTQLYVGVGSDGTGDEGNGGPGIAIEGGSSNTIGGSAASGDQTILGGNGGAGVQIGVVGGSDTPQGNTIAGAFIGVGLDGKTPIANDGGGVLIVGGLDNTVGGTSAGAGNVIAGNTGDGLSVQNGANNLIVGNRIGLASDGQTAAPNSGSGVRIEGGSGNLVGGTTTAAGNTIAGNAGAGVTLTSLTTANVLAGNRIGTDLAGLAAVPNSGAGVQIDGGASANTIGGVASGAGNTIAGNAGAGLLLTGGATGNAVLGDLIGLGASGLELGNAIGVLIDGASNNTVGGAAASAWNVISGNTGPGVQLARNASANVVAGNTIGLDPTGTLRRGNLGGGVVIMQATANTIGGTTPGLGNVIAANVGDGVALIDATNNTVAGNLVGGDRQGQTITDPPDPTTPGRGRQVNAVSITGASTGNTIGGTSASAQNVLADGTGAGVLIAGAGATSNLILGNLIGQGENSGSASGNDGDGVLIDGASGNTVGGTSGNTILANGGSGVELANGASLNLIAANTIGRNGRNGVQVAGPDNTITGNLIGTTADNGNRGNIQAGISVQDASGTLIQQNTIAFNGEAGVKVAGAGASATQILRNQIGTNPAATLPQPNAGPGIWLVSVPGATIDGNILSGNRDEGVRLEVRHRNLAHEQPHRHRPRRLVADSQRRRRRLADRCVGHDDRRHNQPPRQHDLGQQGRGRGGRLLERADDPPGQPDRHQCRHLGPARQRGRRRLDSRHLGRCDCRRHHHRGRQHDRRQCLRPAHPERLEHPGDGQPDRSRRRQR